MFQRMFDVRRIAGQFVKIGNRDGTGPAISIDCFDHRIQQAERNRHIAGVGGDAGLACADYAQLPVDSANRRAARAGLTLVARLVGA
jgi:hypothetical protein